MTHGLDPHDLEAAAPALYTELLAVEWSGERDAWDELCPRCWADASEGHASDCSLDGALRRARGNVR